MKITIEYEVDESLWDVDKMKTIPISEVIELFTEDPIEILGNSTWEIDW